MVPQPAAALETHGADQGEVEELDPGVWRRLGRSLRRDRVALIGAFIVLAFAFIAVFAPALAPHNPNFQFGDGLTDQGAPLPPGGHYLLGTDDLGRDLLSRLI
ncbi:MAG: hypothetical protein ACRDG4_14975, partial [Chloroflexota bacterium]